MRIASIHHVYAGQNERVRSRIDKLQHSSAAHTEMAAYSEPDRRTPGAVRIRESLHGLAGPILQTGTAIPQFPIHLVWREHRQVRVIHRVCAECNAQPCRFAKFSPSHQFQARGMPLPGAPAIVETTISGNYEYRRWKLILRQNRQRVFKEVQVSIVKGQRHGPRVLLHLG